MSKKLILAAVIALPIFFASCSKDNFAPEPITVDSQQLNSDSESTIVGTEPIYRPPGPIAEPASKHPTGEEPDVDPGPHKTADDSSAE